MLFLFKVRGLERVCKLNGKYYKWNHVDNIIIKYFFKKYKKIDIMIIKEEGVIINNIHGASIL